MSTPDQPKQGPPGGVERRKGDRRGGGPDRRSDKRVVTENEPRRKTPDRRKN